MRYRASCLVASLMLATSSALAADDFGMEYAVERVPASRLSVVQCAKAVRGAAEAGGYVTRSQQVGDTLALHVAGPPGDGRALIAYCIQAGELTVYVVQVLDYAGPGGAAVARFKEQVVKALERATGPRR